MRMLDLRNEILETFFNIEGEQSQLLQTSGECGELVAVIQNYIRNEGASEKKATLEDVMKEAVDVFFMIQQIRHLNTEMFDKLCLKKIDKVRKRLSDLENERNSM